MIEASGSPAALSSALELVRPQGVVSVVGAHFEPDFPLNNLLMFEKEISLTFSIGNPGRDRERLLAMIAGRGAQALGRDQRPAVARGRSGRIPGV